MKSTRLHTTTALAACLIAAAITAVPAAEAPQSQAQGSPRSPDKLQSDAQDAIRNFVQKDPTLEKFIEGSAGYAVFPNVGEGGFIVGGARGKGVVYQKGGKAIGTATVTKATVGAQIGGQSFSEIVFFQTPEALRDFKSSNLELSAGVSGVVAAQGAAETMGYQQGVAVFTLPKGGVMGKAAIGGQKFKFHPYE